MKHLKSLGAVLLAAAVFACNKPSEEAKTEVLTVVPCEAATPGGPEDIVLAYYNDSPKRKNSEYFDEAMNNLFRRDSECVKREQGICALHFDIRSDSQDPDIKELRVCKFNTEQSEVEVQFKNYKTPKVVVYNLKQNSAGWRISDVRYPNHDNFSLVTMLSETLDRLEKK